MVCHRLASSGGDMGPGFYPGIKGGAVSGDLGMVARAIDGVIVKLLLGVASKARNRWMIS